MTLESRLATWAGVDFYQLGFRDEASQQTASRVAQGIEGQRIDLVGVNADSWTDFSGGMVRRAGLHPRTDLNQVYYNQGLRTDVPYQLTLPYLLTTQATLTAVDHSGFRAANKRVHSVIFGSRFVACIGTQLFKDTSTTDPTLIVPATADGITDLVTALWVGMVGTSPAVFKGCDGTTDDIRYTTDPFADTVTWTEFVTLSNAADHVSAGQYFPGLGGGNHVMVARIGNDPTSANGLWYVSKDASLPATAQPVVYKDTKDVEGTNATVTVGPISPGSSGPGRRGDTAVPSVTYSGKSSYAYWTPWANTANALTQNDTNVTATTIMQAVTDDNAVDVYSASGIVSDELVLSDFDFSAMPVAAIGVGYLYENDAFESNAGDNICYYSVQLYANGSPIGVNLATGAELAASDTDTYTPFGGAAIRWGIDGLTGATMRRGMGVGVQFVSFEQAARTTAGSDDQSGQANFDHGRLSITYRMPGTQVKLASGGYTPGPWLSRPNTLVYIEPESDDETGITKARRLCFINLEYDADGDRVVASLEYPDTGLSYVEAIWPGLGGWFVSGDKSSGLGKQIKHVNAQGVVSQYNFSGFHGVTAQSVPIPVGIVNGFDEGVSSLIEVANEDGTETQWWRLLDGAYHACTPLQSKSNAIASLPLAWAESVLHRPQNRVYRFFPVSTTHLAAARTFVPRNPLNDVMSNNLTEPKQDGPLYLITPEFELVNFENENALMVVRHGGSQISAVGGSYGTVQYDFEMRTDSTAIDLTFASPDVTTGALDAAFEEYKVPGSGEPFRTMQLKVTLDNDGSGGASVKTPNGLPFETETVSKRPHLSMLRVFVDVPSTWRSNTDWLAFVNRLTTASAVQPANELDINGMAITAVLDSWDTEWKPEDVARAPREPAKGKPPWLLFRQVRGSI